MTISLSDFSSNIDFYAERASKAQITVEKDGKPYFRLSPVPREKTKDEKIAALNRVVGILPKDFDFDKAKTEAISF